MHAVRIIALLLLASCYRPTVDPCRVTCAADEECPSGAACGANGHCFPTAEPSACSSVDEDGGPDGATPDAPDGGSPAGQFKALAVGRDFACAITADGMDVRCWGSNLSGQLGDGTFASRATASAIEEDGPWKAVGAGNYHACAIKESGELYCWGDASYGQVDGTQANQSRPTPVRVMHPGARTWTAVDGASLHTCAIDDNTTMWCWGSNDNGQLGTAAGSGVHTIAEIPLATGWTSISADGLRTCALKTGGTGWCWGEGALGQSSTPALANSQSSDVPAEILGGHAWRTLSAGRGHACGVTTGNELFCFGERQLGELGAPSTSSGEPVRAQIGTDFETVFTGPLTTCATRTGPDRLICFGDNSSGQGGVGHRRGNNQPFMVAGLGKVTGGGGGIGFNCALEENGNISCWGRDDDGRCGDGKADDRFLGPAVMGLPASPVVGLTSMGDHTCVITASRRVFCWGYNGKGQLGIGDTVDHPTAVEVAPPAGTTSWTDISAGLAHTCGVAGGNLYCWGSDDDGQLGNGGPGGAALPQEIGAGIDWTSVSAGWGHTCAIDSNSERWCWGNNVNNALGGTGLGSIEQLPVMIGSGPAGWLRTVSGNRFGCGISSGAQQELWCWGDNDQRELGVGATPATSDTPLRVLDPSTDWQQIAADPNVGAACGIRAPDGSGGNLWCWGYNGAYQLGIGNNTSPQPPTEVGTAREWLRVDLGLDFACGISATLELRCWGYNDSKQVSDSNLVTVTAIPSAAIMPATQFDDLAAGWTHACAVTTAGVVHCWGEGGAGQLGDGNMAHLVPTPVIIAP